VCVFVGVCIYIDVVYGPFADAAWRSMTYVKCCTGLSRMPRMLRAAITGWGSAEPNMYLYIYNIDIGIYLYVYVCVCVCVCTCVCVCIHIYMCMPWTSLVCSALLLF